MVLVSLLKDDWNMFLGYVVPPAYVMHINCSILQGPIHFTVSK